MKSIVFKITAVCMALLLLVSTTSWKVEKHFCMGHLVDLAFFVDAQDCGMDLVSESSSETSIDKKSCCDDEVIAIQGQNDVKPSLNDIDVEQQQFLVAYSYSYLGLFTLKETREIPHKKYIPPKIVKDIQLLDDVFLI
ncbi:HYC_CC_PP family protein [Maribacter luteus]